MTSGTPTPSDDLSEGAVSGEESQRIAHLNELRQQRRKFLRITFWCLLAVAGAFFVMLAAAIAYILLPCTLKTLSAGEGHLLFLVGGCLLILTIVPLSSAAGLIRLVDDPESAKSASNDSLLKMPVIELLKALKDFFKPGKD